MVLSRIWSAFILIALTVALGRYIFQEGEQQIFTQMVTGKSGDTSFVKEVAATVLPASITAQISDDHKPVIWEGRNVLPLSNGNFKVYRLQSANGVFETTKDAVNLCIGLIGIMALFLGFMNIAEKAGGVRFLSKIIGPFFSKIFPEVPKNHPAMGHMVMNFSANLLGLDNAATPFGIKSMESLQELNPDKTKATNAQIMFLCLHASGLTLIPTTIIADRVALKSQFPTEIFIPCMIATFVATITAMLVVSFKQGIRVFQPVILAWVMGITGLFTALILYVRTLDIKGVQLFSGSLSNGLILLIFLLIILGALYKKAPIFDAFVDGAKEGFNVAIRIIPYLVGLLVAISLLRNSGAFDFVMDGIKQIFIWVGADGRIVDALPTAILKPFSGSGARAMMIDTLKSQGPDSFAGNLASVFRGSADTTFYIIAVYFGAVGIKNTRYAVGAMLLADLAGIITAVAVSYLFFG
ncbi:MAG TPA: nucleoside recognition domain-containing protein [Niabella sp.]|nr:nucleoside recognition domain-containing protein [Niabella sp.]HQW14853.1 nucleoside recognition domain-containing protein [Niabella sp.]HQX18522.1 nucleoside recognition domain-containing protein [Niabella sp.]HQX41827.1 nucleoside recognition domain-containing protein [Niabella sp.]HRB06049.1 nucleoside recognition domain-containing protein [Niabella sp.]